MKKFLLFLTAVSLLSFSVNAQSLQKTKVASLKSPVVFHYDNQNKFLSPNFKPILFESFETAFPPAGWLVISYGNSSREWSLSNQMAHSGSNSALIIYSSPSETMDEWLITPAIDLSITPGAKLTFYEDQDYWSDYGDHHYVKISTTSPNDKSSFQTLLDMTPNTHINNGFGGAPVEIDLSNFYGQATVYIAFVYTGSDADNWYIDDVGIYEPDEHDVAVVNIDLDNHYEPNMTIQPTVTVRNVGLNPETFNVTFGYYGWDGNPIIIDTKTVDNLAVRTSEDITFKDYLFEDNIQYIFFVQTNLESDLDPTNNLVTKVINTFTNSKSMLLVEKGTGTWCQYCPGSARSIDHLHDLHPDSLAILEYHYGDNYAFNEGLSRISFYGISGYPTAVFNGTMMVVGGVTSSNDWMPLYETYNNLFNIGLSEKTSFSIDLEFSITFSKITVIAHVTYEGISYLKSFRLFYGVNQSHIAELWQGMDSLQFVARAVAPDENGVLLYDGASPPTKGMVLSDTTTFRLPVAVLSNKDDCELIAFIQNMETKEIVATTKISLAEPSSVENHKNAFQPTQFSLLQNYPNPFNPDTRIQFQLPEKGDIEIKIYNLQGQLVRHLVSGTFDKGQHNRLWDGKNDFGQESASGVYLMRASYQDNIEIKKLIKMK